MQKYIHLTFQIGFKTEDSTEKIQEVGEENMAGGFMGGTLSVWLTYSSDSGPQLLMILNRLRGRGDCGLKNKRSLRRRLKGPLSEAAHARPKDTA